MYRMKAHSIFSFNCVTNLDLLLRGRQLSFKLYVLLLECGHRLFELLACLFKLYNEVPGFLVGILEKKNALSWLG